MNPLVMLQAPSIDEVWKIYKIIRKLKPLTVKDYEKKLRLIPDFTSRSIDGIRRADILALHDKLLNERGLATANYVIRIIAALLQFSIEALELYDGQPVALHNPARIIKAVQADETSALRRAEPINQSDLAAWYSAVQRHPSNSIRDWMLFMLYTGARRTEATELKHEHFENKQVWLAGRVIPASRQCAEILERRNQKRALTIRVFDGRSNGGISDWNKSSLLISKDAGVRFTPYQLRLTYRAIAVSIGIPETHIGRLMRGRDEFISEQLIASQQSISDEIDRLVLPNNWF